MDTNNPKQNKPSDKQTHSATPDLHGAAIINDQGVEVPITEDMIKAACDELGAS